MIARLIGAGLRAFLVALLVATPAVIIPGVDPDLAQIIALLSLFAAMLTIIEYASAYPSFVEFRDAQPYNRLRFIALSLTIVLLALIARGLETPNLLSDAAYGVGRVMGNALDFPFSPVRLMLLSLPDTGDIVLRSVAIAMAGLAMMIMLLTVGAFYLFVKLFDWPSNNGAFNFWINLPLFDPTAGGDVLDRLRRDSNVNLVLGFLVPFLVPAALQLLSLWFGLTFASDTQTLIWLILPWTFLPTSMLMRGIALGRIASMIEEKRKRAYAQAESLQAA